MPIPGMNMADERETQHDDHKADLFRYQFMTLPEALKASNEKKIARVRDKRDIQLVYGDGYDPMSALQTLAITSGLDPEVMKAIHERMLNINKKESESMFNYKHVKEDGTSIAITQMSDDHLQNTLNLFFKGITEAWDAAAPPAGDPVARALYGSEVVSAKQSAAIIKSGVEAMTPYLLEAMLRPAICAKVAESWQKAMRRSEARPTTTGAIDLLRPLRIQP